MICRYNVYYVCAPLCRGYFKLWNEVILKCGIVNRIDQYSFSF